MNEPERLTTKRQIARLIGSSPYPVYALDSESILIYANDALCEWLKLPIDLLLGLHCSTNMDTQQNDLNLESMLLAIPGSWTGTYAAIASLDLDDFGISGPCPKDIYGHEIRWGRCFFPIQINEGGTTLCLIIPISQIEESDTISKAVRVHESIIRLRMRYPKLRELWYLHGSSDLVHRAIQQAELAITSDSRLTIFGQLGSGRTHLAKAIHAWKSQHDLAGIKSNIESEDRFIQIDCGLMDRVLLRGVIELIEENIRKSSSRITVLVDNLESLPNECFSLLQHFLTVGNAFRLMVTCAYSSTTDPTQSKFLESILNRSSTLRVEIPSLVDRADDISVLIRAWLEKTQGTSESRRETTQDFVDALTAYAWPGDTEEFSESMQYAIDQSSAGEPLSAMHLPVVIRTFASHMEHKSDPEMVDLDSLLDDIEKTMVLRALKKHSNNKSAAAKMLCISRARLIRKLHQWGVAATQSEICDDGEHPDFHEVD